MSFGGFSKQSNNAPMSEINTTPLVDVMLVLLIIFIITAPLITNNVNINLPSSKTSASSQKPNIINIGVDDQEKLFWNGKEITAAELPQFLEDAVNKNPQIEMRLQADRNTKYQEITEIMVAAKKAGINKIGFSTRVGN